MRNLKWLYACSLAIAFGVLSFTAVSCHDDDDEPKQEPGEEIVTPDPVVEYYIMGTVTDAGKGLSNVDVKIGSETIKTDKDGKFSVTEKNTGKYSVEVAPKGYLAQNTINGKTNCSTFTKHFVPNLILLTQNKMCILLRWFPIYQFCLSLHQFSIGAKVPFINKRD